MGGFAPQVGISNPRPALMQTDPNALRDSKFGVQGDFNPGVAPPQQQAQGGSDSGGLAGFLQSLFGGLGKGGPQPGPTQSGGLVQGAPNPFLTGANAPPTLSFDAAQANAGQLNAPTQSFLPDVLQRQSSPFRRGVGTRSAGRGLVAPGGRASGGGRFQVR